MKRKEVNYKMEVYPANTTNGVSWNVIFPEVFGCGGEGKTYEEAIADAKVNLDAHLSFLEEEGIELPETSLQSSVREHSGKLSIRIPKSLHSRLEETSDEMFNELDYYKLDGQDIAYRNEDEIGYDVEIFFYESLKNYRIYTEDEDFTVSVPLHKAITKKMEELGWL